MSEPLNTGSIAFYLNFKSDDYGRKRIDEPIGFDAVDFTVKQDIGRMGRDIFFAGSDQAQYEFINKKNQYGHEFDRLIEYDKIYGYESDIEFIIHDIDQDIDYVVGELEYKKKETDHYSYFRCNVIVSRTQALVKRKIDTKVDVFSDEDLDGNPIEPVQTSNILVPAKPVIQSTEWGIRPVEFQQTNFGFQSVAAFPIFSSLVGQQDIQDSLIPFDTSFFAQTSIEPGSLEEQRDLGKILRAQNDLSNITVSIKDLSFQSNGTSVGSVQKTLTVSYGTGFAVGEFETIFLEDTTTDFFNVSNQSYEVTVPFIQSGGYLWIRYSMFDPYASGGATPVGNFGFSLTSGELDITLTSTGVDTVAKGVRWKDAISQVSKSINPNFTFTYPRFESLGEHYNNFIVDGNMLRGREYPLVISAKESFSHLNNEVNCDYEVNEDSMFVGNDEDFYPNVEIGAFDVVKPDDTYNLPYNDKYIINEFNYKYKKFDQDKDNENTIDAIHTEADTLNANRNAENTKKIECDWTRDPFLIASTQAKASNETSTSVSEDDQKFILDCTEIAPNATRTLTRRMQHYLNGDGNLQLLGSGFNWTILGFQEGDSFTIDTTSNAGTYTVDTIETNIVTLIPVSASPASLEGEVITQVTYPLTDVQYIYRTNEGFDLIEGVLSPNEYGNLRYTIKRNVLNYWSRYIATSTLFKQEDIRVTYLKNNVNLSTQYLGGDIINELDPITQDQLKTPLVTARIIQRKVQCDFSTYRELEENIRKINDTDAHIKTKGGFVRVCGNNNQVLKGYIKESSFNWKNNTLDLTLEEKYEDIFTTIDFENSIYMINEVGYSLDVLPDLEYTIENDYIQFFDANTRPLTNVTRFDFVKLNGEVYNSIVELATALNEL